MQSFEERDHERRALEELISKIERIVAEREQHRSMGFITTHDPFHMNYRAYDPSYSGPHLTYGFSPEPTRVHQQAESVSELKDSIDRLNNRIRRLEDYVYSIDAIALRELGFRDTNTPCISMMRYVVVFAWIKDERRDFLIRQSLDTIMDTSGFLHARTLESERGSLFQPFIYASKRATTQAALDNALSDLRRAAELKIIEKQQAEVNVQQAQAASTMLGALGDNGYCIIGDLLIAKIPDNGGSKSVVMQVSQDDLKMIRGRISARLTAEDVISLLDQRSAGPTGYIEGDVVENEEP